MCNTMQTRQLLSHHAFLLAASSLFLLAKCSNTFDWELPDGNLQLAGALVIA